MDLYDIEVRMLDGRTAKLRQYAGEVLLVVNVASRCGYTPQYTGLEALYRKYHAQGFEVLGFPCDQFGNQEPGNEAEIRAFCTLNYQVSFPLFAKLEVNGAHAHPLYQLLKSARPGVLNTAAIKWNFTKFLVARNGEVLRRYAPGDTPESLADAIEAALAAPAGAAASG
ncbi:MAG: glutathione peroxidase [Gammaproteobacteria bacterium]|nr:glutathione peroxidase [Gammaproteobacteria bacterium]MDE2251240.1 glutathione peroxidase [Gammaproteobacteria bacterium]